MNIADKIKAIREAKKIKQSEIARAIGVEPTNYPRIEKRGDNLPYAVLTKIAAALGVSNLELITWGESDQEPSKEQASGNKQMSRIKELEDRLKDKTVIIENLDNEIYFLDHIIGELLYFEIYGENDNTNMSDEEIKIILIEKFKSDTFKEIIRDLLYLGKVYDDQLVKILYKDFFPPKGNRKHLRGDKKDNNKSIQGTDLSD